MQTEIQKATDLLQSALSILLKVSLPERDPGPKAAAIRALLAEGVLTPPQIAHKTGVSRSRVYQIKSEGGAWSESSPLVTGKTIPPREIEEMMYAYYTGTSAEDCCLKHGIKLGRFFNIQEAFEKKYAQKILEWQDNFQK